MSWIVCYCIFRTGRALDYSWVRYGAIAYIDCKTAQRNVHISCFTVSKCHLADGINLYCFSVYVRHAPRWLRCQVLSSCFPFSMRFDYFTKGDSRSRLYIIISAHYSMTNHKIRKTEAINYCKYFKRWYTVLCFELNLLKVNTIDLMHTDTNSICELVKLAVQVWLAN